MPLVQQHNLNGGEISRRLWNNTSRQRRASSVALLENFHPGQFGGVSRRPGMEHIDVLGTGPARMLGFKFSETTKFELAFGDHVLRIYSNGLVVPDPINTTSPLEIETPWADEDVSLLRWYQVLDTVWITHPDYYPRVLFRRGDQDWILSTFATKYPPFGFDNKTTKTLTPSGTSGSITVTASSATFDASHAGSYWKIGHNRDTNSVSLPIAASAVSDTLLVDGDFTVTSVGDWVGTLGLEFSADNGGTWESWGDDWTGANDKQVAYVGTTEFPALLRLRVKEFTSATDARIMLGSANPFVYGLVQITGVTSETEASAIVIEPLHGTTATMYWAEGAWSDYQGYPRCVSLVDGRLVFASTYGNPLAYWSSWVDGYNDFRRVASNPDASQFRAFYSETMDGMFWVEKRKGAVIFGSAGDEWQITNFGTADEQVERVSYHGSANVPAVTLHDSLVFVQRGGKVIRDFVGVSNQYAMARDPNVAINLTGDAEHITINGVQELVAVQSPVGIIYGISQGNLFSLTYDRDSNVMGFSRHPTDGYVHSMCVTPGEYGDQVTLAVTRNGTTRIERFHPETPSRVDAIDVTKMTQDEIAAAVAKTLFLDGGKLIHNEAPSAVVTGLDHWEGETLDVLRDGWVQMQAYTVTGGSITLDQAASWVAVGKGFTSENDTLPAVYQTQTGETRYLLGRVNGIIVDVHNTFGLEYADADANEWYDLQRPSDSDDPTIPPRLQSEPIAAPLDGKHSRQGRVKIRQKTPLPATILGLSVEYSSTERK